MPDDARPYVLLGIVQAAEGDLKAKKNFIRALEVDPRCMDAVYRLVDLYNSSQMYREAIDVLEGALQQEDSDQIHYRLGDAYFALDEWDVAIEQYQQALALNANCKEAQKGLEKIQNPREQDESMENGEEVESNDESNEF
jgi:tetratricopeptide (TPR) repeat protein